MASYKELQEQIRINRLEYNRLEKELEEIENSPISDTDVVVKYSGSIGSDYSVNRITNMEKGRVKELLELLTEMEEDEWDGNLEEYLEQHGAEVIPVLSTAESRWDGYPPFYDLEYDIDTNKVYDSTELSVGEQAENFVDRIEFGETVFNDEERKLVINYADQLGDTESAFALARSLRDIKDVQNRSQIIENAKNEIELYTGSENRFGIYQLKSGEELHYHRFEPLDRLEQYGRKVEKANYDLIYTVSLREGQSLDDIYEEFNLYRPEDFHGHSLSISDIVLMHRNGENHSYYVDRFGFQEVPQFQEQIKVQISATNKERSFVDHYYVIEDLQKQGPLDIKQFQNMDEALQEYFRLPNDKRKAFGVQNSQPMPGTLDFLQCRNGIDKVIRDYEVSKGWNNPEIVDVVQKVEEAIDIHDVMIAYKVGNRYLSIQSAEEGFDYTIYNSNYREWDGGIYDDPFISLPEVIDEILGDQMLGFDDCQVINYDDFMEEVENTEYFPKQAYESLEALMKQVTMDFAVDFDRFEEDYDTYEYGDAVESKEENIMRIYHDLCSGNGECIRQWLQDVIDEEEPEEDVKKAQVFLKRLDDLAERRAKNPFTQTEELEEAKRDQIDRNINTKEEKSLSIMERIAHGKQKGSRGKEPRKNIKLERG